MEPSYFQFGGGEARTLFPYLWLAENRMSKYLAIILACVWSVSSMAQADSTRTDRVGASYLSEGGFYPGFAFNYERKLLSNQSFQLLLAAKAGAYFHYQNHTGIFVMVQSGQRFRIHKKLYFEHFLGLGYLHTFLNGGDAYYVNAAGQVQKSNNAGNPHFMPSISFGLSYDCEQGKHPFMIFIRPMIFWQIPFNQTSLVQYAFEVGTLFKLKK